MSVIILHGDVREHLRTLSDESVHCCVTSPPYWGLRDYGHADQIGLESSPQAYTETMVAVFREVRRVLRNDGTLWLNLGDSYSGSGKGGNPEAGKQAANKGSQTIGVIYETGKTPREAAVTNVGRRTLTRVFFMLSQPKCAQPIEDLATIARRLDERDDLEPIPFSLICLYRNRLAKAIREQTNLVVSAFYASHEWLALSYQTKIDRGRKCECCGATAADGSRIVTDHIEPLRFNWERRLDPANLQILCDDCNVGKGSWDATDHRFYD